VRRAASIAYKKNARSGAVVMPSMQFLVELFFYSGRPKRSVRSGPLGHRLHRWRSDATKIGADEIAGWRLLRCMGRLMVKRDASLLRTGSVAIGGIADMSQTIVDRAS